MKKHITIAILTLASALFVGCATSKHGASIATENTQGGYTAQKPHYTVHKGVLYANDGSQLWYLRKPYIPMGHIRGAPVCQVEEWAPVGGSHVRKHQRMPLSFRNQAVQPSFVEF